MATKDDLTSIAEYVWRYISPKIEERLAHNVQWYRAKVTQAAKDDRISIQRPFDETEQSIPYLAPMASANAGDEVTVFVFGGTSGGNNNNSVIVNNGSFNYFAQDFVAESGTSGGWEYIKYASGLAMMWCNVTAEYSAASVLEKWVSYPFTLKAGVAAFGTLEGVGSNSGAALGWNVKVVPQGDNKNARVFVHNPSGSFGGADALTVSVLVLGRYEQENQAQIVGTATVGTVITADQLNEIEESNYSTDSKIAAVKEVMSKQ